jgi:hypothetical protein
MDGSCVSQVGFEPTTFRLRDERPTTGRLHVCRSGLIALDIILSGMGRWAEGELKPVTECQIWVCLVGLFFEQVRLPLRHLPLVRGASQESNLNSLCL